MSNFREAQCGSCGEAMVWARKSNDGKPLPFDADPVSNGRWALRETEETDRWGNQVIEAEHVGESYSGPKYQPHFTSCPNADQHRKAKKSANVTSWATDSDRVERARAQANAAIDSLRSARGSISGLPDKDAVALLAKIDAVLGGIP